MVEKDYIFSLEIKVRDYEIDSEGIVNNANYLHYFEYTRHEFCEMAGLSFSGMLEQGIVVVLRRVEVDYITSLHSNDVMLSKLWVERKGPRFVFHQDIFNKATGAVVAKAVSTIVSLVDGKLSRGDELGEAFKAYL